MSTLEQKRISILDTALSIVRNIGFESLSIAKLAKEVGMSKSGLFAHFNSKEKMHVMILDHAATIFADEVFRRSLSKERGIPRLRAIIENWVAWYEKGGGGTCPFLAASIEYDRKPGVVKDRIVMHTNNLIAALERTINLCIETKDFSTNIDTHKVTYELYSLIIGHLVYLRMMEHESAKELFEKSIGQLIERCQS